MTARHKITYSTRILKDHEDPKPDRREQQRDTDQNAHGVYPRLRFRLMPSRSPFHEEKFVKLPRGRDTRTDRATLWDSGKRDRASYGAYVWYIRSSRNPLPHRGLPGQLRHVSHIDSRIPRPERAFDIAFLILGFLGLYERRKNSRLY